MTITKAEIVVAAERIARILYGRQDAELLVGFERRYDSGPWVEVRDGVIHYIVQERGYEHPHNVYDDLDEFMYVVTEQATSYMGRSWESKHREEPPEDRDPRIGWLAKQIQLMRRVNPAWAERLRASLAEWPDISLEDIDTHPVD
ncbi:Imm63 family immunity protein [Streptomyces sp. HUAS TT7]|uniref:Imm63 family immunity protein n=1 Tax=Streptomyces sp. HUAS TT7 TaxID=3447507 RepID=UPI003F655534